VITFGPLRGRGRGREKRYNDFRLQLEGKIMKIFLYYYLAINLFGVFIMYSDKQKSQKRKWRTPENTLFAIASAFGALGIFIGMRMFRHKTKHNKFVIGIPLILAVQLFIFFKYIYKIL
jgi:uncharacterized membrane protein YsdA (DUF1294 family)